MKTLITVALTVTAGVLGTLAFIYSGAFDISADQPHSKLVYSLAETTRERSIAARSKDLAVPDLEDRKRVETGASEYAEMCTGCHLAPGMEDNELRPGLYPAAPNLAEQGRNISRGDANTAAARQFWIIKHGIKMSAMPAWGKSHDDQTIWSMVAFLQRLPELTPEQYAAMTRNSESAHQASGHIDMHGSMKGDRAPEPAAHQHKDDSNAEHAQGHSN